MKSKKMIASLSALSLDALRAPHEVITKQIAPIKNILFIPIILIVK
jgi:hypothetical protein